MLNTKEGRGKLKTTLAIQLTKCIRELERSQEIASKKNTSRSSYDCRDPLYHYPHSLRY